MSSDIFNPFDYLKHIVDSPTQHQTYIYELWNKLHFSDKTKQAFSSKEILNKNLKYIFPYYNLLTPPFDLPDINKAIKIVHELFHNKSEKKLIIFADRDADGICSASILYLFFRDQMGIPDINISVMLPGIEDKYGVTLEISEKIIEKQPDILITLDNGSSNKVSFDVIRSKLPDIKTIIIDHHSLPKTKEDYPNVDAFINPIILNEKDSRRQMCTSGLAFMFIYALTYSFTEEYNKITLLNLNSKNEVQNSGVYVKNGILIDPETPDKIFYENNSPDANNDFNKLWNTECINNFRLSKINNLLLTYPNTLELHEKLGIFQSIKMKNVFQKVRSFLPFAAIGTIADSMQLLDDNRILVYEGLLLINEDKSNLSIGLKEIIKALELFNVNINELDLAFSVCPAVNAAGRMGQANIALSALTSKDPIECAKNAFLLKEQNEKRKLMSSDSLKLLEEAINSPNDSVIVCYHEQIHRGISGIIASKLAEKYKKPALVLVNDGEYLRGSIRSYKSENVLAIIHKLAPWFVQFGGHIQAAGFSLEYEKRIDFISTFIDTAKDFLNTKDAAIPETVESPVIYLKDVELTPSLWKELLFFAPYGIGNPRPKLSISPTAEITYKLMGKEKNHARVNFTAIKNASIEAVWFNFDGDLYNLSDYKNLKIITEPQINYFRGVEKYQLRIIEVVN
ncbi:MAG: DHH family phosphoesterase [Spirochaetia bacterium]|nr:DHH family phosphoesterase [Spirochaetia bacterium]